MQVNTLSLKNKILEFYPEIGRNDIEFDVVFDDIKNAWVIMLQKGTDRMYTHLEKKDAERCLTGVECIYLGTQIGMFIRHYCMTAESCPI